MERPFERPAFALCVLAGLTAAFWPLYAGHLTLQDHQPATAASISASSPFVDVHAHLDPADPRHSIEAALQAMPTENAAQIVFMPPPFTLDDTARYDADIILSASKGHEDKVLVLGGGGTLNAMIQESVASGDSGGEVRRKFRQQAEELLRAGVAGFGEMTAEHFQGATPYQSAPPDHPLFLLLADIAAEHGVPIALHMEAVPRSMPLPAGLKSPPNPPQLRSNVAAFERLVAHNRHARIIWAHAGWDNTGYRTPELCRRLLTAHPNLYMDIKIDPANPGKNSPLVNDVSGPIDPEWLQLFQDFPDRFVIGTDQHYPEPKAGPQRWQTVVLLFNQLRAELQQKIGMENAARLYGSPKKVRWQALDLYLTSQPKDGLREEMKRRDFCKGSILAAGLAQPMRSALENSNVSGQQVSVVEFPKAPGLTRYVSEFIVNIRYEEIPQEVIALGKKSILDGFGLALAGSVSTLAPLMKQYIESVGPCAGKSSVIGSRLKVAPRFAAFANGNFIHADDYDDTQLAVGKDRVYGLLTHPTVPVLPPALALCESGARPGKDFLAAYHVGVEVECKIAEAISPRHYNDGFHTTGTIGCFGSAAACAKLRGLDASKTANALGVAAAEAGGLRENFGSMTKPFHAGHAAEAGVVAADLAALGWTAATNILEAQYGFFHAAGGSFDPAAIVDRLGKPWTFVSPGVSIKPHPSGSLTHPAMGELMRLIRQYDIKAVDVEKVDVGGNNGMVTTLLHHHPTTGLQAKFSMEFGVAILLLERKAGLAEYTDAVVQRPDVQEMIGRVNFYVDSEADQAGFDKMTSIIKVHMKDGRVLTGRSQFAKGSPANPMSYDEVADKFRGCAEFAQWPRNKADALIEFVKTMDTAPEMSRLTALLTP